MSSERTLKGWHVAGIFGAFFGTIITVNLALAYSAVSTFPGVEVGNSYVASQSFDARRGAQEALGWTVEARPSRDTLTLAITDADGAPVSVAQLDATLGRATHVKDDQTPAFQFDGAAYVAPATLAPGYWNLRMKAKAHDGTAFEKRIEIFVSRDMAGG